MIGIGKYMIPLCPFVNSIIHGLPVLDTRVVLKAAMYYSCKDQMGATPFHRKPRSQDEPFIERRIYRIPIFRTYQIQDVPNIGRTKYRTYQIQDVCTIYRTYKIQDVQNIERTKYRTYQIQDGPNMTQNKIDLQENHLEVVFLKKKRV